METLIEVTDVRRHFPVGASLLGPRPVVKAVDGVSFSIGTSETLGVIGESGCGKTTMAKLVLGLDRPTDGSVRFRGDDLRTLTREAYREYRRSVQAVFQDPQSSLNPRMRVWQIVAEPLIAGQGVHRKQARERVIDVLSRVGIDASMADRFPHQFSGGQRQRIAIARALAARARVIVLDEPVASLDVSVRSQVLNLLKDLQEQDQLSYLLISHDLATSAYLCHRLAVMYLGRIVEMGPAEEIYRAPKHPYTRALLAAAEITPLITAGEDEAVTDEIPSPISPPPGCHFHPRCPRVMPQCSEREPILTAIAAGQYVRCHLYT
ncbi:MAG: peptide/nickel transport system ATP-binding protein [Alphaproteobacteria bacterium]|jgi:oligopeptide/dipeptide ABC transporter ATP-binding protein|nr:peptide/nickel transport system ATP-binding protein [Alphaproteobacteria bacterium]MEA3027539.1 peptide/nickel transport system ATP-binding protein [Alphaproteobacteria bacterium]